MDFVSSLSYPQIKPKTLPKIKPKIIPKTKPKQKTKPKRKPKNDRMKFGKTLLDAAIKPSKLTPLPEPLVPTPYVPLKPKPKQRRLRIVAPVALPRNRLPMKVNKKVKKLIDEIRPYYTPEAISQFKKDLKFIQKAEITEKKKALKGNVANYGFSIVNDNDPSIQLADTRKILKEKLNKLINEKRKGLKFGIALKVRMKKETIDGVIYREPYFNSKSKTVTNDDMITESIIIAEEEILNRIADWLSEGSQWVVDLILEHYLNIINYQPLRGGSYLDLPKVLKNPKKGLINPINEDNKCLLWCHVRHLNPEKRNPQRIKLTDKEFAKKLDYSGVSFPVKIKDISKIEIQNQINISVFGYESKRIFPIKVSNQKYQDHMELLYLQKGDKSHYVYIKDFNSLMYNFTNYHDTKHFCMYCLHCFSSKTLLENHIPDCYSINGTQAIVMPAKGSKIYFKNYHKIQPVPFVIYADFEALTKKIDTCHQSNDKSFTDPYQEHQACGYGYKVVCHQDQSYSKPLEIYRGEDVIEKFIEKMYQEVSDCQKVMKKHFRKRLIKTKENELDFQNSTRCYICGEEYTDEEEFVYINGRKHKILNHPVRDHCHITGKYRGSAHNNCNLQLRLDPEKLKIPVIFHNLKGYDSHFIIKKLEKNTNISVIANNFEKYISFRIDSLQFIDSFQFMSSSLDRLVSNLPKDKFINTDLEFKDLEPFQLELLKKKGVYPYSYMDSFNKFEETELPNKKGFFNDLNNTAISDSEYQHAREVWDAFKIKNLGEYHDLYLKTDVLLLADIFENFRETCLKYYGLDPAHYLTSPGLAWDAMLKMTKIELDLITDIDQQLFIEKGLRGGISYITHRYARANNKYLSDYNPEIEDSYLTYQDANNLYGWAMIQKLPTSNLKWINPEIVKLENYDENSDKGIILEVDLEYPKELHDLHNEYPCAPEKMIITNDMLSDYARKIKEEHSVSSGKVPKLVTTLYDKEKYVLHYRNLQLYLSLGLKVKKIHRVLEFDQSSWLKEYIDFNTEMRKNAKNSFEKDFFKLMNNSVFGKTMENVRKRTNIELVTDEKRLNKLSAKPTYVSSKIFNENLVAVHTKKERLLLDKPSYVGMCILDLSKTHMYDFHYNYIKKKYPDSQLLFTDTDSLFYHIKTEKDIYEEFWVDRELFDNSDYPKSSKFFFNENKKVIGKFKDETAGKPILEFVGLKSKMYSYKIEEEEHKKAKGVKKNVVKKEIKHQDYLDVLFNKKIMHHQMNTIRSESHQINSYHLNKVSLSPYDDKRYLLDNGIKSYAYGNYKIHR